MLLCLTMAHYIRYITTMSIFLFWKLYWDQNRLTLDKNDKHDQIDDLRTYQSSKSFGTISESNNDNASNQKTNSGIKTILLWNRWYMWPDYRFGLGSKPFQDKCGLSTCLTTTNKSMIHEADVVVFFATLVYFKVLPKRQNPNQIWVFMDGEPAAPTYGRMWNFGKNINLTITYRSDSDIPWPYGEYQPLETRRPSIAPSDISSKVRPVAWMASRCGANANNIRINYVMELGKYIQVDVYGKCGNFSCDKFNTTDCMETLDRNYKLYLAFENSICKDYVTEKAFRTLQYNLVPVVMGGADYTRILPPNSFIDAKDFASPKDLAEYLQHLHDHPSEFLKYLAWKEKFFVKEIMPDSTGPFCTLCDMVSRGSTFRKDFNVSEWWEGDSCVRGWTPLMQRYGLR